MKVGIVGYGLMGKRRAALLDCETVIADAGDPIGPACDCDATLISVPTPELHTVCLDALAKGARRILLEKPCSTTSDEAREIWTRAEECRAIVVPAYTLRHYPGVRAAREDTRYGRLLWASLAYGHGGGASGWRAQQTGGGELLDQGSHLLDLARWFDTCGITGAVTSRIVTEYVDDHVSIGYGRHTLLASWAMWTPTFRVALYYERGSCEVRGLGGPYQEHGIVWREKQGRVDEVRNYGDARETALRAEWASFVETPNNDRLRDAIRVLELIEEVRRCAS